MYTASDLKKGLKIEIDGTPYVVTEFNFMKPGKGQAVYTCKLKNMFSGATMSKTYRSADKIDEASLEQKTLNFSYRDGPMLVFMDQNYEQIPLNNELLGDSAPLLSEDMAVDVLFHNDRPIEATLPTFVEKKVLETPGGAKGNTATSALKDAAVEGGRVLQVPPFVNTGDTIKIDTRTGEYVDRVQKQ
ncbi:MAG: elongation factor P [Kiritimatiellia bacterium]